MSTQTEIETSTACRRAYLSACIRTGRKPSLLPDPTDREDAYLRAWAENPEFAASAAELGIYPDLPKYHTPANDPGAEDAPGDYDRDYAADSAAYEEWRTTSPLEGVDPADQEDAPARLTEAHARAMAIEMTRAVIEALTHSAYPLLRRQAETLLLAVHPEACEERRLTEIAEKYGVSKAAVSKDLAHMRRHKSIGVITDHAFSRPETRQAARKRAVDAHARNRALTAAPPVGSIAALVASRLQNSKTK